MRDRALRGRRRPWRDRRGRLVGRRRARRKRHDGARDADADTERTGECAAAARQPLRPRHAYSRRATGVVTIYADLGADGESQGSGFIVDDEGTILTNAHVVTNVATSSASRVRVPCTSSSATASGCRRDRRLGPLQRRRRRPRRSRRPRRTGGAARRLRRRPRQQAVAAIGSPFGNQSSLAVGVVSATGRSIDSLTSDYAVADAIQIDAPINRGNSGGPLFDARGRVIGINAQIRSDSGTAEGVGFAIPINVARRALERSSRRDASRMPTSASPPRT